MKRYLIPILALIIITGTFSASGDQAKAIADNYQFDTALELSRILDRQFVFSFVSASCSHCQIYKDEVLSDPGVRKVLNNHFVLSFVTVDETFEINLPSYGKVTNMQLASGLGIEGTPTTYIFYPPNPELLQEGRGITSFPGTPPEPQSMVDLLERIATESFKDEEGDESAESDATSYYNYRPAVKKITNEDYQLLQENSIEIPTLTSKVELSSLPEANELIVNLSGDSVEEYAEKLVSSSGVHKVFIVGTGD